MALFELKLDSLLRWFDAEMGDRFSAWRMRRMKKKNRKLRDKIDALESQVRELELRLPRPRGRKRR